MANSGDGPSDQPEPADTAPVPAQAQPSEPPSTDIAPVEPIPVEASLAQQTPADPSSQADPSPRAEPASAEPSAGPPTCYRHPGRETHIRCTRCQRSICPDCMISAAVGFQCPNCVQEGSRDVRAPRTRLGGKVQANSDIVTKTLIGINVGMFLLALLGGRPLQERLMLLGRGFSADAGGQVGVAYGEWYRLLTATFLHIAPLHLALNMFALWIFGTQLERQLGRARYLTLYLICGLAGSAASYAFTPATQASLGASGAVFGLVGAALVIGRKLRYDVSVVAVFLVLNLVIGFGRSDIDWRAHLGGLVAGLVLGAAYAYAPAKQRTNIHIAGAAGLGLAVIALVALRTAALT